MATLAQLQNGELKGIKRLQISAELKHFPVEIFELAETLEILDLSGNCLSELPDDLPRLQYLKVIFCSNNQFKHLPTVLGKCPNLTMVGFKTNQIVQVDNKALPPQLRWLILTDNQIKQLPEALGDCFQLQKLMLSGNQLTSLPITLNKCTNLELIRFSSNCLTEFPQQLLKLPRLAWLAFSNNPFCSNSKNDLTIDNKIKSYDWNDVQLGSLLGEGASGCIYQAKINHHFENQELAIKIFKGAMTSDGVPESELNATLMAGLHAHLIPLLGQIQNHPSGLPALIMQKLEHGFSNLAGPPSLSSCTRDVYPENSAWTIDQAWFYAKAIATVMAYLHQKGILHGDLYAHNILIKEGRACVLSDFGAASIYAGLSDDISSQLEAIEVRAYIVLIQELFLKLTSPDENRPEILAFKQIMKLNNQQNNMDIPNFNSIKEIIMGTFAS